MTAKRPTVKGSGNPEPLTPAQRDQELQRCRSQLAKGRVAAVMEHIESVAQRDEPDLLRGLITLLADTVRNPPRLAVGRPHSPARGKVIIHDKRRVTIVSGDMLTQRERRQRGFREATDKNVWITVIELQNRYPRKYRLRDAAIRAAAAKLDMTEGAARKAFYRFQKS